MANGFHVKEQRKIFDSRSSPEKKVNGTLPTALNSTRQDKNKNRNEKLQSNGIKGTCTRSIFIYELYMHQIPKCKYADIRYVFLAQKGIPKLAQENKESKEKIVVPIESNSRTGGMINIETKFSPIDPKLVSRN